MKCPYFALGRDGTFIITKQLFHMEIAGGRSKNRLSFSGKQTEQFQEKWNSRARLELFAVSFCKIILLLPR